MSPGKLLFGASALIGLLTFGSATASAAPVSKCNAAKKKCIGKYIAAVMGCHAKAESKNLTVDQACLDKATAKITGGKGCFDKADVQNDGCSQTGDAGAQLARADLFIFNVVTGIDPGYPAPHLNKCDAAEKKCVGKMASGLMACSAKENKDGIGDPSCAPKIRVNFDTCFYRALLKDDGPCDTDATGPNIRTKVDTWVADAAGLLDVSVNAPCGSGLVCGTDPVSSALCRTAGTGATLDDHCGDPGDAACVSGLVCRRGDWDPAFCTEVGTGEGGGYCGDPGDAACGSGLACGTAEGYHECRPAGAGTLYDYCGDPGDAACALSLVCRRLGESAFCTTAGTGTFFGYCGDPGDAACNSGLVCGTYEAGDSICRAAGTGVLGELCGDPGDAACDSGLVCGNTEEEPYCMTAGTGTLNERCGDPGDAACGLGLVCQNYNGGSICETAGTGGDYEKCTPPPCTPHSSGTFTDNCDGTVTDSATGLMWEQKTGFDYGYPDFTDPHNVDNRYSLSVTGTAQDGTAFTKFLAKLNDVAGGGAHCFAGHCDWRLPTVNFNGDPAELETILLPTCPAYPTPCIDPIFGPTVGELFTTYMSTTAVIGDDTRARGIHFASDAHSFVGSPFGKLNVHYARAVRGGPSPAPCEATTGGYCWFMGAAAASCTTTCANAQRTYDFATDTYAGSAGTDANCQAVLSALGVTYGSYSNLPGPVPGLGCHYVDGFSIAAREPTLTTPDATDTMFLAGRACACQ